MDSEENKIVERYKERIRRQNQHVKENYDKISATLPKGTIERIKALGMTINGAVNNSLLAFLDIAEEEQMQLKNEEHRTENVVKSIRENTHSAIEESGKPLDIIALQAELNARNADQYAREKAKQKEEEEQQRKREEEYISMVKALRDGAHPQEDEEKERIRQENITRANIGY